mgnify:CR=1 FL=1
MHRVAHILWLAALAACLAACASPTAGEAAPTPTAVPAWDGQRLPTPGGPYGVGHRQAFVTDTARAEVHTPAPDDSRELLVHIWYPADPPPGAQPGPYMEQSLALAYDLPPDANTWLGHAVQDAPLADTGAALPVVIFNAGFNSVLEAYAALLEELASRGYVVAATSHPYADQYALLADGSVVEYPGDQAFVDAWEGRDPYNRELYEMWVPDTLAVVQELVRLNQESFDGRLALDRLAFAGHSFGGGASAEVCRLVGAACAGAINLDGSHSTRLQEAAMEAPYLYIAASQTGSAQTAELRRVYEAALSEVYLVEIAGATHFGFSDGYYLLEAAGSLDEQRRAAFGTIEPERMIALVRAYSLAFLDCTLRGLDVPALEDLAAQDPEITLSSRHPRE